MRRDWIVVLAAWAAWSAGASARAESTKPSVQASDNRTISREQIEADWLHQDVKRQSFSARSGNVTREEDASIQWYANNYVRHRLEFQSEGVELPSHQR